MLHLLSFRYLLQAFAVIVALFVVGLSYADVIGSGGWRKDATLVLKWSGTFAFAAMLGTAFAWRFVKPLQLLIFPYLGGTWTGKVVFEIGGVEDERQVELRIRHNLAGLRMRLESKETVSNTLVVQAERDPAFGEARLYYAYLNQRREGVQGAGTSYRGLAIIRVVPGQPCGLEGDYFTDTHRRGTLHLLQRSPNEWWLPWT